MAAITAASANAGATLRTASKAPAGPGLASRIWAAFVAGRMRQAEREIALHPHLLPAQFEHAGHRLARSEKDLPFFR